MRSVGLPDEPSHRRFMRLFLAAQGRIKSYLLGATGSTTATDDLLQEVASALWESFEQYDAARPFDRWALGFARMEVLDWRKRLARRRELLSEDTLELLADTAAEVGSEVLEAATHALYLRECTDGLRGDVRRVFELRYGDELPVAGVASRVGKNVAAVEMTLVRVRRLLRDCVQRKLAGVVTGEA